jgi:hypothetical protein
MSSCLIAETFQDAPSERSGAKSQQGPVRGLLAPTRPDSGRKSVSLGSRHRYWSMARLVQASEDEWRGGRGQLERLAWLRDDPWHSRDGLATGTVNSTLSPHRPRFFPVVRLPGSLPSPAALYFISVHPILFWLRIPAKSAPGPQQSQQYWCNFTYLLPGHLVDVEHQAL